MKPKIKRPVSLENRRNSKQVGVECEPAAPVEKALARALEIAQNNGSIILSAGSIFVTAEVKMVWQRISVNE